MKILIDNIDILTTYNINVLDYTGVLSIAGERSNEREWYDKSGVDKNLVLKKYDSKEFVLSCYCKETNEVLAYSKIKQLTDYMFSKTVFVLSLHDDTKNIRQSFLCTRSGTIIGDINVRVQNSLYVFKLGLKDVNPNALQYFVTPDINKSVTILYDKGIAAVLYWGDGTQQLITNSGSYTHIYNNNNIKDIIIDVDKDATIVSVLNANFVADSVNVIKPTLITFTDLSIGDVILWSWDFGDGETSDLQNPTHTYLNSGVYTVVLQVFSGTGGVNTETKTAYITVRDSLFLINNTDSFLINNNDKFLIN